MNAPKLYLLTRDHWAWQTNFQWFTKSVNNRTEHDQCTPDSLFQKITFAFSSIRFFRCTKSVWKDR